MDYLRSVGQRRRALLKAMEDGGGDAEDDDEYEQVKGPADEGTRHGSGERTRFGATDRIINGEQDDEYVR